MQTNDYDQWVHFYEDDVKFERVWNRPHSYLSKLSCFNGVITPDFSLYRDMPLVMQEWNTYRGKALGCWWQAKGLNVLPNVRFSDYRSFSFCCQGIPKNSTICIGSHGCLKVAEDRREFKAGLQSVINELHPTLIIFYGAVPSDILQICISHQIKVIAFKSEYALSRKKVRV